MCSDKIIDCFLSNLCSVSVCVSDTHHSDSMMGFKAEFDVENTQLWSRQEGGRRGGGRREVGGGRGRGEKGGRERDQKIIVLISHKSGHFRCAVTQP